MNNNDAIKNALDQLREVERPARARAVDKKKALGVHKVQIKKMIDEGYTTSQIAGFLTAQNVIKCSRSDISAVVSCVQNAKTPPAKKTKSDRLPVIAPALVGAVDVEGAPCACPFDVEDEDQELLLSEKKQKQKTTQNIEIRAGLPR